MKCPKCRAEILSNTIESCPYCGSPLAVPPEKNKKAKHNTNHEANEIAQKIKEAIELQKAIYKPETKEVARKLEKAGEEKKYSTSDIVILFASLAITFIVLAITLSLILRK